MNQNAGSDGLWLAGTLFIAKVIAGTMPAIRQGGFKLQVQQVIFKSSHEIPEEAMEKMENKERFPLSHGTTTTISLNLFMKFVALEILNPSSSWTGAPERKCWRAHACMNHPPCRA
jgi:hypothetical protein